MGSGEVVHGVPVVESFGYFSNRLASRLRLDNDLEEERPIYRSTRGIPSVGAYDPVFVGVETIGHVA